MLDNGIGTSQDFGRTWTRIKSSVGFRRRLIIPLFILLHLCITLALAYKLNIWIDEAYTLHTTGRNVRFAFDQALRLELQPPLYFILLSLWRDLNDSIFFTRLFSVLCSTLTIYVGTVVSRKFIENLHPGWFAAAIALHPFMVWAGTEIRVYAFVILLSALLLLLFYDGYLAEMPRSSARWLHGLVAMMALYTQYYAGYLLLANAFALLVLKRWPSLRSYLLAMIVVGICFTPMLSVVVDQVPALTKDVANSISFFQGLKVVCWRILRFLFPLNWYRPLAKPILSFGFGLIVATMFFVGTICSVVAVMFYSKKLHRSITPNAVAVWTATTVVTFCFIVTVHITGEKMLAARHMAILFLPLILSALFVIRVTAINKMILIWTLTTVLLSVTSVGVLCMQMAKSGDWDRVASYIMASEKPGQAILVFLADSKLPLTHYYKGQNSIVALPTEPQMETFDVYHRVLSDEQQIIRALQQVPKEHKQIWLVTDETFDFLGVDYRSHVLENFTKKYYSVERSKVFFGAKVRLLHRRPSGYWSTSTSNPSAQ